MKFGYEEWQLGNAAILRLSDKATQYLERAGDNVVIYGKNCRAIIYYVSVDGGENYMQMTFDEMEKYFERLAEVPDAHESAAKEAARKNGISVEAVDKLAKYYTEQLKWSKERSYAHVRNLITSGCLSEIMQLR